MTAQDWKTSQPQALGMLLNGRMIREVDDRGRTLGDDTLLVIFNTEGVRRFTLPQPPQGRGWELVLPLDTARGRQTPLSPGSSLLLQSRQVRVLRESPSG